MSLQEQQNFLARLYTDSHLRRAFLTEPQKIGRENDLNEQEINELAEVLPEELNFFADSLFWKRLREVENFLPLTRKILDDNFTALFREFSQNNNPQTIKKHLEDAIGFCTFLQKNEVQPIYSKDAAKFEQSRLVFYSGSKSLVFSTFRYDVREILKNFPAEISAAKINLQKRKTFAIWLRIGKMEKHFIW